MYPPCWWWWWIIWFNAMHSWWNATSSLTESVPIGETLWDHPAIRKGQTLFKFLELPTAAVVAFRSLGHHVICCVRWATGILTSIDFENLCMYSRGITRDSRRHFWRFYRPETRCWIPLHHWFSKLDSKTRFLQLWIWTNIHIALKCEICRQ